MKCHKGVEHCSNDQTDVVRISIKGPKGKFHLTKGKLGDTSQSLFIFNVKHWLKDFMKI